MVDKVFHKRNDRNFFAHIRRILCLILTCFMVVDSMGLNVYAAKKSYFEDFDHTDKDFSDMEYIRYDGRDFQKNAIHLSELCKKSGNQSEIIDIYEALIEELDYAETMYTLVDIYYYQNIYDEEIQEEQLYMEKELMLLYDQLQLAFKDVLNSEYKDVFTEHIGEENASMFQYYEELTPLEQELSEKNQTLIQEYYILIDQEYENDVAYNEVVGAKYIELLECRNQRAREAGYDNYAEYGFYSTYYRDYSLNEMQEFCDMVKREIVPILDSLSDNYSNEDWYVIKDIPSFEEEEIVEMVGAHIGKVSPELEIPWNYMLEHELYDIETSSTKAEVGFTVSLPSYNSAFILNSPSGTIFDVNTMIHEFGHFANSYYTELPYIYENTRFDLYEVHSQGLEAIYLQYYEDMYGDMARVLRYDWLYDMFNTIVYYCYIAELEMNIYRVPDVTVRDINLMSYALLEEYGYPTDQKSEEDYEWVYDNHLMTSPMYSISYSVSAMASLDIWMKSQKSPKDGIHSYMELSSYKCEYPFREALELAGFNDIFSEAYTKKLNKAVNKYIKQNAKAIQSDTMQENKLPKWIIPTFFGAFAIIMISIVVLIIVIFRKREEKYF